MAWNRAKTSTTYSITVPAGSEANVVLPIVKGCKLFEGETEIAMLPTVSDIEYTDSSAFFKLGSGSYTFTMNASTLGEGGEANAVLPVGAMSKPATYYNINGMCLSAFPSSGIVLKKAGNTVSKLLVK